MRCYLLDGLRAQEDYNGWDINTQAFEWFLETPLSIVMPVGGQSSFYTDWYQPACGKSRLPDLQVGDVPDQRAAAVAGGRQGRVATGNAAVGLSMAGNSAMILAVYHPRAVHLRRVAVGVPEPVRGPMAVPDQHGDGRRRWIQGGRHVGSGRGPNRHGSATTRWCRSRRWWPTTPACGCTAATAQPNELGGATSPRTFLEGLTIRTNLTFQDNYIAAGGQNAVFNFPPSGTHNWAYWGQQLQQMKPDLISYLG